MPQLLTQSVNIQNQGGSNATIDLYITQTGLTSMSGSGLLSTFTSNTIAGTTAQMRSYYSATNADFSNGVSAGQTLLATGPTFNGPGTAQFANLFNVTGPWSETVRYTLAFTGGNGSNFNGTANLTAVPEPATWGLMLLGFGAMGGMLRTRRQTPRVRFA
ncbi:PEP-CTERM sorting domain-containing protein [Sphingomonas panacisoli]|uniref:PEP-CTERM sorting domain-containing protein n=2 Tax=Sphingomonas panacisoli TaxID=1813879 RepID=A0A5B8LLB2_9SPHN|nr:PEP-CTERM sorting domain-containing protein [Sphingomonas panacisoli]